MYGGRIAEELVFGSDKVTTGASNDIQRATEIARNMVTKWGLSEKLGPLSYDEEDGEVFLGKSVTQHKNISDETAHVIDEEIRNIIERNYVIAEKILKDNKDKLHTMAEALIEFETIDADQIDDIMECNPVRKPKGWDDSSDSNSGSSSEKADKNDKGAGKIGDPAGEH